MLIQMAKIKGSRVIAVVSTSEKAALATEAGADDVIISQDMDFETTTMKLTKNRGVQVVYDGVGKDTFLKGINCLAPLGMMVLYGQASGPVDALNPSILAQKGSLFLTRPQLGNYIATRQDLEARSHAVFELIASGRLTIHISEVFALSNASKAHEKLQARKTTGKLLLVP